MHVDLKEPVEELQRRCRREKSAPHARRLRIIILPAQQHTAEDISHQVDLSPRQVQSWVRRYNREGLAGLADRPGRGPKPSLTSEEAERLRARLDAGPGPEDGVCAASAELGPALQPRRLGWSGRSARPWSQAITDRRGSGSPAGAAGCGTRSRGWCLHVARQGRAADFGGRVRQASQDRSRL